MSLSENELKTADLYDVHEEALQVCEPGLNHYGGHHAFHGPVATVKCFEDNSLVRDQLEQPGSGRVLVVDGGASLRCALLGDVLAQLAVDNGWAGVVVNGCIRDSKEMAQMPLGVMALATHPRKSVKKGAGEVGGSLNFFAVDFHPGEWLYADEDGVVVLDKPAV
jgi:regulator of ribonuclease activity A